MFLFYHLLRAYVTWGLRFYFYRWRVTFREPLPQGPILFVANHQNAFLDAVLVACSTSRILFFLARADVFRNRWAAWCLARLHLSPVYRLRDGIPDLHRNHAVFRDTAYRLRQGHTVLIFPEGSHHPHRRVRPFSKGFTRIVDAYFDKPAQPALHLVPVGLNYTHHSAFRSQAHVIFGAPITLQASAPAAQLRAEAEHALRHVCVHIPEHCEYDTTTQTLQEAGYDFLEPAQLAAYLAAPRGARPPSSSRFAWWVWRTVFVPPLAVWKILQMRVKDPVFTGSLKFATGILVFPLYLLAVGWAALLIHPVLAVTLPCLLVALTAHTRAVTIR